MPVFFVAAGFFAALLFYKKGPEALLRNRFQRILLPFVAGVIIIWPLVFIAASFSIVAFEGSSTPYSDAWQADKSLGFIPLKMVHLWFLYFLVILALASYLLAILFRKKTAFTLSFNGWIAHLLKNFWIRIVTVASFYFLMLIWMGTAGIITSVTWIPTVNFI